MDTPTYLYRCTEQQLESHLQRIAEEGDVVEHVIFKGGRDYVLVCRKAADRDSVAAALEAILAEVRDIKDLGPWVPVRRVCDATTQHVRGDV